MLCSKVHCHDANPSCLVKDLVFFDEYTAVNIPKLEDSTLDWLFVLEEQILNRYFF